MIVKIIPGVPIMKVTTPLQVVIFFALSTFLNFDAGGQSRFLFHRFYPDDGLSNSRITTIAQDYLGFIWVGTNDGLNRYDGYEFRVYRNIPGDSNSLDGNIIEKVFEDSHHNLWIGTSEGLSLYDRKKDEFIKYTPVGTIGTAIRAVYEDKDGTLWAGGSEGLQVVDKKEQRLHLFSHGYSGDENHSAVTDILRDAKGKLWVATRTGLRCYDPSSGTLSIHFRGDQVNTLFESADGMLWAGTYRGLFSKSSDKTHFDQVNPTLVSLEVFDIHQHDHFIWIATVNGFFQYDLETGITQCVRKYNSPFSLSDNMVRALYEDQHKNLWLGTFNGLNLADHSSKFFHIKKPESGTGGLSNDYILSTYVDRNDHIWVGTGNGVAILKIKSQAQVEIITNQFPELGKATGAILSIVSSDSNLIWLSAWPGRIYTYDIARRKLSHYTDSIPFTLPLLALRKEGGVWIGTEKGLYTLEDISKPYKKVDRFSNHVISYLSEDEHGLWIGYQLGLIKYDPTSGHAHHFKNDNPPFQLNVNNINCIYRDRDSVMWIGTEHGLHERKKNGTFESHWMKYGFPDHSVMALEEDRHGNLWIAANDGLYRFTKKTQVVRAFDRYNGIPGKEFLKSASSSLEDRQLIFGGTSGLVFFSPDSIERNNVAPQVVLTDLTIMNRPAPATGGVTNGHISVASKVVLDYTDREFSVGFVALSFSEPQKISYAYKLEGFDTDWNYVGTRRFASYTNLETGKEYIFKVRASNSDGIWSAKETSVKIYIRPPFWETWWFRGLVYFMIALSIYVAYRIRFRVIRAHRIELRRQVRKQTAQLKLANDQIEKWNVVLKEHNKKLQDDVRNLNVARVLVKPMTFVEFCEIYPNDEACYKFVEELKWKNGFRCPRCESTAFARGAAPFSRRCVKCNHVDRVTSGTVFSRLKFPITKAFYLLFLVTGNSNLTLRELSEIISLRQQTCWIFRSKAERIIKERGGVKNLSEGWKSIILTNDEEQITTRRRSLQRL